tara:strand:+ start:462 stop:698 length:237 start_codon:yes stop_codon:yes gene_type:complete
LFKKFKEKILPVKLPLIKLTPTIKPTGKDTVSDIKKLIFFLFELFCMPIIKIKNNDKLKVTKKISFLKINDIILLVIV